MPIGHRPFPPGTPCWVDLLSTDVDAARTFYSRVFGWTADDTGRGEELSVTFRSDGHRVAGLLPQQAPALPSVWSTYFASDDLDATVAAATAAGARVMSPVMTIGDRGSTVVVGDPAGGVFCLWRAGQMIGFEKSGEPHSVVWNEFHSKDFTASTPFYAGLFDWGLEVTADSDQFRYRTATIDGRPVGGMMDAAGILPPEVPSNWVVYFGVEDTDLALTAAVEHGGTPVMAAEDTPFGRIATVADPTGAVFTLLSTTLADPTLADQE